MVSRSTMSAEGRAVLAGPVVPLVIFVEMGFSVTLNFCTAAVDLDWNGITWSRAGSLGSIEPIQDTISGDTTGLRFTLSGVPSENISLALQESARGKSCKVWVAVVDPDTHAVLDAPLVFSGLLDQMPITLDGQSCTVSVTAEHQGKVFSRPRATRYNNTDQAKISPGDTSMRFLVSQANHQDVWPAASFYKQ